MARFGLTDRQCDVVFSLTRDGQSTNDDIARDVKISPRTVRTHMHVIYSKLNVKNRVSLLKLMNDEAARLGLSNRIDGVIGEDQPIILAEELCRKLRTDELLTVMAQLSIFLSGRVPPRKAMQGQPQTGA